MRIMTTVSAYKYGTGRHHHAVMHTLVGSRQKTTRPSLGPEMARVTGTRNTRIINKRMEILSVAKRAARYHYPLPIS